MLKRLMSFFMFFGLFSASYAESDEVLPTNYPPFVGIGHTEYGTGVYGSSNNTPWNGFIGMTGAGSNTVTTSASCSADPLLYEGQEQNSGTYYFQAQWRPNHYDVEYNSGSCGGNGITDAGAAIYGEDYQIKGLQNSGVTEPAGYEFTGWVGTSEGLYNGSDTLTYNSLPQNRRTYGETDTVSPYVIEGNLLLTALCEAIPYHITYDCNCNITGECSGNAPTDDNSYYVTSNNVTVLENLDNNGCAWDEHAFQGWNCTANSDNSSVSDSDDYPNQVIANWPASDVTCRAKWSGEQHHIYYTCGSYGSTNSVSVGGTPPTDSTLYYTGTTPYALAQDATGCTVPNGYHFVGWNCDKNIDNGSGQAQYNANEQTGLVSQSGTYNVNGDTNCAAMWDNNQINLIWQGGASGVTMPGGLSSSCFYGSGTINVKKPTRPGYTFVGWKVIGHCEEGDDCPPTWPAE